MSLKNTTSTYGSMAIALHWIMAILVIVMISVGFYMGTMPKGDPKWEIMAMHKASGLIVLVIALFRWYWVLTNEKPKPLDNWSKADIALSHATKWLLMILIVLMPVAGIIMSLFNGHDISFFGLFNIEAMAEKNKMLSGIAHTIHEKGAWVIAIIAGLHILAAFKHHFMSKDETLNRMLGRNK